MIQSYLKYRRNRVNAHGIHSPFVFEFYNEIIKKAKDSAQPEIEALRKQLLRDKSEVKVIDFGAGSKREKGGTRLVSEIAKNAAIPAKFGRLIARIIAHYELKSVLELGTSLGIGTAYLSVSSSEISVVSLEGCPNTAALAKKNLETLGLTNAEIRVGEFSNLLQDSFVDGQTYDLIYIDGNHQFEPTINYFNFALNHLTENGFIIFDDIYWSSEMEQAWQKIKSSDNIHVTLDLFRMGIVCKRNGQRKQDFVLKYGW